MGPKGDPTEFSPKYIKFSYQAIAKYMPRMIYANPVFMRYKIFGSRRAYPKI